MRQDFGSIQDRRTGFTLVELAIVLVIIGLLVGGILASRSLLDSARTNAAAKQLGQFDIAIENFKTKYKCIPGDCNLFTPAGDNDGKIEDASGNDGQGAEFTGEVANFWVHLEQGNQIKATAAVDSLQYAGADKLASLEPATGNRFTATVSGSLKNAGESLNVPASKIGNSEVGVIVTNDYLADSDPGSLRAISLSGAYVIAGIQTITDSNLSIAPSNLSDGIRPVDAAALDLKLDDGKADAGAMFSVSRSGQCSNGEEYNAGNDSIACSLAAGYLRLSEAKKLVAASGNEDEPCPDPATGGSCETWNTVSCAYDAPDNSCPSGESWDYGSCGCTVDSCSNTCMNGGGQNAAPDCTCIDSGCAASGGSWDNSTGDCTCQSTMGTGGYWLPGTGCACSGGCESNDYPNPTGPFPDCSCTDPGCTNSGGSVDPMTGHCTCTDETVWNGSACVTNTCSTSCQYGSQNASPDCTCNDPGCAPSGGSWDSSGGTCSCPAATIKSEAPGLFNGTTICACGGGMQWDGSQCSYATCQNYCQYGAHNAAPDCSCVDPGCATSGGIWDTEMGICSCPVPACGGAYFDGTSCQGGAVTQDFGCANSGGTWDQCTATCTCPTNTNWDGANWTCVAATCGNSCSYGSQNSYPDCSCADPGCSMSGGSWDSNGGTCMCSGYGNGSYWDGSLCQSY